VSQKHDIIFITALHESQVMFLSLCPGVPILHLKIPTIRVTNWNRFKLAL